MWNRVLFAVLSLVLVAANVDTALRIPAVHSVTRSVTLLVNEIMGSLGVLILVTLPWLLGG